MADSFSGATRERRLDIMQDSRIGCFGTTALILPFALKIQALAALVNRIDPSTAFAAILIAAFLSHRAGLMLVLSVLAG